MEPVNGGKKKVVSKTCTICENFTYTYTLPKVLQPKKLKKTTMYKNYNVLSFIYENVMTDSLFLWLTLVVTSLSWFGHAHAPETS